MHERTDVVRIHTFTEEELRNRLGLGGEIVSMRSYPVEIIRAGLIKPGGPILTIKTTMIHPEDARYRSAPIPGECCRICGAGQNQPHHGPAHYAATVKDWLS